MAHLDAHQPSKIYRGAVEEIFSWRSEIPPDATLELKVFEEPMKAEEETGTLKDFIVAMP